jgi:hypothetical protein
MTNRGFCLGLLFRYATPGTSMHQYLVLVYQGPGERQEAQGRPSRSALQLLHMATLQLLHMTALQLLHMAAPQLLRMATPQLLHMGPTSVAS